MNSRNMKKIPTWKYLCPKQDLTTTFWAILLMVIFEDLILVSYIWVPNTTIESIMVKQSNLNNTLLLFWGIWPLTFMVLIYQSIFFRILDRACSPTTDPYQCVWLTNFIWHSTSNRKCYVTSPKTRMNVNWHIHFIVKCHLNFGLHIILERVIFWIIKINSWFVTKKTLNRA